MAREKKDVVANVMVRLDAPELGALEHVGKPGEARAHTLIRCMMEAVLPRDILLRFRMPPGHKMHRIFPDWMQQGPMSPSEALWRGEILLRKGCEIQTVQVPGVMPVESEISIRNHPIRS
tara:strand:+ start:3624 stop:3983 length:360 start_codon:yes stop_codon:yes gene_type:complete